MKKGIKDFEYLVGMPISSLTAEKIEELMRQHETKTRELEVLKKKTIQSLWLEDLDALEVALADRDKKLAEEERIEAEKMDKARAKKAAKGAGRGTKRSASEPPATERSSTAAISRKRSVVDEDDVGARGRGRPRKT